MDFSYLPEKPNRHRAYRFERHVRACVRRYALWIKGRAMDIYASRERGESFTSIASRHGITRSQATRIYDGVFSQAQRLRRQEKHERAAIAADKARAAVLASYLVALQG